MKSEYLLQLLEGVVDCGDYHKALCPAHADTESSLSIRCEGGNARLKCFAGCREDVILQAIEGRLPPQTDSVFQRWLRFDQKGERIPLTDISCAVLLNRGLPLAFLSGRGYFSLRGRVPELPLLTRPGDAFVIPVFMGGREVAYQVRQQAKPKYITVLGEERDIYHETGMGEYRTVVEGPLKADVVSFLKDGMRVVGLLGITSWRSLKTEKGETLYFAPDADLWKNRGVASCVFRAATKWTQEGAVVKLWDSRGTPPNQKGLDDFLLRGGTPSWVRWEDISDAVQDAAKTGREVAVLSRGDTIQPVAVSWLWPGRCALGELTLLEGDPGVGKSLLTATIAARVSKGEPITGGQKQEPGDVVFVLGEDSPDSVTVPRLKAAGADLSRVHFYSGDKGSAGIRPPQLPRSVELLEEAISSLGVRLVIIDPLLSFLGEADTYKSSDIRGCLNPLVEAARRKGFAILATRHNRKSDAATPVHRGEGSIAISAMARLILQVGNYSGTPHLVGIKSNLGPLSKGIRLSLSHFVEGQPVITLLPAPEVTYRDLSSAVPTGESPQEKALSFILRMLADGKTMTTNEIIEAAESEGIPGVRILKLSGSALHSVGVFRKGDEWGVRGGPN